MSPVLFEGSVAIDTKFMVADQIIVGFIQVVWTHRDFAIYKGDQVNGGSVLLDRASPPVFQRMIYTDSPDDGEAFAGEVGSSARAQMQGWHSAEALRAAGSLADLPVATYIDPTSRRSTTKLFFEDQPFEAIQTEVRNSKTDAAIRLSEVFIQHEFYTCLCLQELPSGKITCLHHVRWVSSYHDKAFWNADASSGAIVRFEAVNEDCYLRIGSPQPGSPREPLFAKRVGEMSALCANTAARRAYDQPNRYEFEDWRASEQVPRPVPFGAFTR